jgi:ATP-dependent DNA helicase RecG
VHPDHILDADEFAALPLIEPVYPLTEGLSNKVLSKLVRAALEKCPDLPEWQEKNWLAQQDWPDFNMALKAVHFPQDAIIDPLDPAHARLAFDELLSSQLALALTRAHVRAHPGAPVKGDGRLRSAILAAFGHELTSGQTQVLEEIYADLAASKRMLRLLQGDVGAGKTIVALLALATAIEAGFQGALMAPTELLARQHMATIEPLCRAAGIRAEILTGRDKGKARAAKLEAVAAGNVDILIGTHALIQEDIAFSDLALAIIDEQHRFGVRQRLALQAKGQGGVDVLVMTATPIPRTLTLAQYGDMDISRLTGRPSGRQAVDTRVMPMTRLEEVVEAVGRAIATGQRAYWVCPLVEDSDLLEVTAAEERYRELVQVFGGRTGLVHGRMKPVEREQAMEKFRTGEKAVLVATTVIEVGVDVPEATIMVIEHAERFGLAQLHQLRGRIGRGSGKSTCLLLYQPPLGEIARERLTTLRETDDGFVIAEQDLKLRGAGDLLGARQSGLPQFRIADLAVHGGLLEAARDDARLILSNDPHLQGQRGPALKTLLYLFRRDSVIHLLASG